MNAPGLKLVCRPSYSLAAEKVGSPFDYPLSSRYDENDMIFILDKVKIPWKTFLFTAIRLKRPRFYPVLAFCTALRSTV